MRGEEREGRVEENASPDEGRQEDNATLRNNRRSCATISVKSSSSAVDFVFTNNKIIVDWTSFWL